MLLGTGEFPANLEWFDVDQFPAILSSEKGRLQLHCLPWTDISAVALLAIEVGRLAVDTMCYVVRNTYTCTASYVALQLAYYSRPTFIEKLNAHAQSKRSSNQLCLLRKNVNTELRTLLLPVYVCR